MRENGAMTKPVNLRLARKAKEREEARRRAAANAAAHGRPKAERKAEEAEAARAARALDGKRIEDE